MCCGVEWRQNCALPIHAVFEKESARKKVAGLKPPNPDYPAHSSLVAGIASSERRSLLLLARTSSPPLARARSGPSPSARTPSLRAVIHPAFALPQGPDSLRSSVFAFIRSPSEARIAPEMQ